VTSIRDIVRERGGDLYQGGNAAVIPGPGHSRTDRSLSLRESNGRIIWHSFAEDKPAEVMRYLGIDPSEGREATREERDQARRAREAEKRRKIAADRAFCEAVWNGTDPLEASAAEAYLWSRGLIVEDCRDIRFHREAPRGLPREPGDARGPLPAPHPAMVAVVRKPSGVPAGLHVTYVLADGTGKAFGNRSRLMFGQIAGNAVHLTPPGPELAIGEGIETCAAYRARTGLLTWAALSTSQLRNFELPSRLRRLVIAADGDKGGMDAALALVDRAKRVCAVEIDPAPEGKDWADVWEAQRV
jgi:hypothetical protein